MRKIFLKLTLFFSGLLFISFLFNYIIDQNYTGLYENVDLNFETYLFSDSHGLPLSNNLEKAGIFNFSVASDSYYDIYRKINYLIQESEVKKIIVSVDDHTLSPYREQYNNLDRSIYFATIEEFDSKFDFYKTRFIFKNFPIFKPKARDIVKSKITSKLLFANSGHDTSTWDSYSKSKKTSKSQARFKTQFRYKENSKPLAKKLEDIIILCKQNEIELIGIKFPLSMAYLEVLGENNYNADNIFINNKLPVWDYKKILITKPEYFENQDHLNIAGGKVFSELLIEKINDYKKTIQNSNL